MLVLLLISLVLFAVQLDAKAPLLSENSDSALNGSYIIVLKPGLTNDDVLLHYAIIEKEMILHSGHSQDENAIVFKYDKALNGYSARLNYELREKVREMPEVEYMEKNQKVHVLQHNQQACTNGQAGNWGLGRTTVEKNPGNLSEYHYDSQCDGKGVEIYIVDSGINLNVPYFEGRAKFGANFATDDVKGDPFGHGTEVTGPAIANLFGIARGATAIDIRVFDKNGITSFDAVIKGMDYVMKQTGKKRIMNMSLGGDYSQAVNQAVKNAAEAGVHVVVAAGNEATNSCRSSPSSSPEAITVGATDIEDKMASFSDSGECTDLYGPGVAIRSATNVTSIGILEGTSIASPFVAGVLAKFLTSETDYCRPGAPNEKPESMKRYVIEKSNKDKISGIPKNISNRLIYMPCKE